VGQFDQAGNAFIGAMGISVTPIVSSRPYGVTQDLYWLAAIFREADYTAKSK
jgi:hypothetical protein